MLPLVFLKYLSDSFDERRKKLVKEFSDPKSDSYKADPKRQAEALEERDYYRMVNVFYVPESARWQNIQDNAKQADIAIRIDDALFTIEKENPKLDGVVKRTFAQSDDVNIRHALKASKADIQFMRYEIKFNLIKD